jgi:hypothetical protein
MTLKKPYHRICCKICFAACVASLATSNGRRGITKLKNKKIRNFEFVLLNKKEKIIHIAICLEQGFSTFWCSRTPKSTIAPKLYPLVKKIKNKLVYVLLLITTTIHCLFAISDFFFFGYLTNLSHLR